MSVGKEEGKSKTLMVESYGLHGGHHIILEGCTFPPKKGSSMVQSLGPMTILLCYIWCEPQYRDKWLAAAKRTFAFTPDIDQLLAAEIRDLIPRG
ncbi:unnamed protein product [Phaedon cochleariae]|uniref:Uncharacterized protein n=1 Tax=Phaedon cochleariae TaxID=80249 RepID=A0A9N9WY51_PHACE|nr:unnamed protein product [Phaedon cochleariae]